MLNVGEYGTQGDKILLLLDASSYAISVMHMHIVHILSLYIETQNVLSSGSHEARGGELAVYNNNMIKYWTDNVMYHACML